MREPGWIGQSIVVVACLLVPMAWAFLHVYKAVMPPFSTAYEFETVFLGVMFGFLIGIVVGQAKGD